MRLGDVECDARHDSLRRYEQRLERSEKTTSDCPGTARMAIAANRARDRGASGDRRRLSQSGRDWSASAGRLGTASTGKTGQRGRGDHRVRRGKTSQHGSPRLQLQPRTQPQNAHRPPNPNPNPNPDPENLPSKGKAKATAKPANADEVTTGFGVELSASERQPPQPVPSSRLSEPFRDAIELGLSQGRNAIAIWQDMVSESGFRGGYQTVKRFVRKLRGNQPLQARAVILTAPGEEAQVDYGTGPMV